MKKQQSVAAIYAAPIELEPVVAAYPVPVVNTIAKEVPYTVKQPVIQPYIQRVIRQAVPVIEQQIQPIYTPVVQPVAVKGPVQTVFEESKTPAAPVYAQGGKGAGFGYGNFGGGGHGGH
jgi:hypothetical protein